MDIPLLAGVLAMVSLTIVVMVLRNRTQYYHKPNRRPEGIIDYLNETVIDVLNSHQCYGVNISYENNSLYISTRGQFVQAENIKTPDVFPASVTFDNESEATFWIKQVLQIVTKDFDISIDTSGEMQILDLFENCIKIII